MRMRVSRFRPLSNFMKSQGLVVPLGTLWGTTKFFLFWFKNQWEQPLLRSIFSKKSMGHKIKIKFFNFWKMLSLIPILYSKKSNLKFKKFLILFVLFCTFFLFFQKQVLPCSHNWKKIFGVSQWNLVILNVFDLKSADFLFKMS